jgi:hypothetical protein
VATQANLTNQSAQTAAAVAQRAANGMHSRHACMREIVEKLQRSRRRPYSHQISAQRQACNNPALQAYVSRRSLEHLHGPARGPIL